MPNGLHITPGMLEQTYELLRLTPPFKDWKLPEADDVIFSVLKTKDFQADYHFDNGRHHIRVSYKKHKTLNSLTQTIAHELCHMYDRMNGVTSGHGATFQALADKVCLHHLFDRGQF